MRECNHPLAIDANAGRRRIDGTSLRGGKISLTINSAAPSDLDTAQGIDVASEPRPKTRSQSAGTRGLPRAWPPCGTHSWTEGIMERWTMSKVRGRSNKMRRTGPRGRDIIPH